MARTTKDYDVDILYHPGKANIMTYALNRKSMGSLKHLEFGKVEIFIEFHQLDNLRVRVVDSGDGGVTIQNAVELPLVLEVKQRQHEDLELIELKECMGDPLSIVPIEDVQITETLSYEELPIVILDRQVQKLRTNEVSSVMVLWRNNNVEEMTWETEEEMRSK
ncbi:hypothetical protein MTR67_051471 [Solanum verrucosum]|uniref:Uncharacterized protein n=1 Tax=Solanum verrucosum TaxID=315347 RepID=A0AAF0V7B8_SOLVR|nr:hypothetical protein MTR67_051471 [Solanum verrucosum]